MEDGLSLNYVTALLRDEANYSSIMDAAILDNCICDEDYDYITSTISDLHIQWCMEDWRPIIAGFVRAGGNQGYHACVIDAIHRVAEYIRVCDPNCGRIYSYRDTLNEDKDYYGEYTYTNPETDAFYYMNEQISTYH